MNSICKTCHQAFHISPSRLLDKKVKRGVYCCRSCKDASLKDKHPWNYGTRGLVVKNKGSFAKSSSNWTGSYKEYQLLHHWVRKTLGKPFWCTFCFSCQNIQWANISRNYRKDEGDWFQLCKKCHYEYDNVNQRRECYA